MELGLVAALLLAAMIVGAVLLRGSGKHNFHIGPAIHAPGKPHLAISWSMAAMVAPDGSLWLWGTPGMNLLKMVGNPTQCGPGKDKDWNFLFSFAFTP